MFRLYLEGQALYEKIVRGHGWSQKTSQQSPAARNNLNKLEMVAKKLNFMFSNVDHSNQVIIFC